MLLKSEVLTAIHGAQGYRPAYTYTPSYHPKPAVHRVFLIGEIYDVLRCSILTHNRVEKNDNSVNPSSSMCKEGS